MNWRFVYKPKWLLGHVIIIAIVILFVNLAQWQFWRLHGREQSNGFIRAAMSAPALPLTSSTSVAQAVGFRHSSAAGTWLADKTVYVRYPIVDSAQGYYVLEPLQFADGTAIVVNRGWIDIDKGKDASEPPSSANTMTTITGLLMTSDHTTASIGKTTGNPAIPTIKQVDLAQLQPLMGGITLAPKWLQLQSPVNAGDPKPLPPPELGTASHFSYALQWYAFAGIGVIGWAVVLFMSARDKKLDVPS